MAVHQDVAETMRAEVDALDRLAALLDRERQVVRERDTDALEAVTGDKEALLAELGAHGERRIRMMQEAGYSPDQAGMDSLLAAADNAASLRNLWEEVGEKLAECQRRNQVNGQILAGTADQTRRLLSMLVGAPSPDAEVYDRRGDKHSPLGGRTSTKA